MYYGEKLLTAKERDHLAAEKITSTGQLRKLMTAQAHMRTPAGDVKGLFEPCWICRVIAGKLGYPLFPGERFMTQLITMHLPKRKGLYLCLDEGEKAQITVLARMIVTTEEFDVALRKGLLGLIEQAKEKKEKVK
jgi:hypothetical protein